MKILLLKNKQPVVVYHQDYRVIDHYEEKIIDIVSDKTQNKVDVSYSYNDRSIGFQNFDTSKLSEAMVIYNINEELK